MFVFLGLVYLTQYDVFRIHLFVHKFQDVIFFQLCSTPLCKCATSSLSHSLVEGHLGCFQVLAMTNNAAVNIVEHMFLWHD